MGCVIDTTANTPIKTKKKEKLDFMTKLLGSPWLTTFAF